jgi:hypothetical protein
MIALMGDIDDPNAARLREILREVVSEGFGGNQRKAADGLGVTQPLLSQVLAKGSTQRVGPALVFALAKYSGRSLDDLWGWAGPRWRGTEGWDAAVAAARIAFPRVSDRAWRYLGDLMGAPPPSLEPGVLGTIAATWDQSPQGRAAAVREESETRMAAEDKSGAPPVEPFDAGPAPRGRKTRASVKK